MSDLKRLCEKAGFRNVRTYIASGNVVAERDGSEAEAKAALEAELKAYAGKPVGVIVRTAAEMAKVVADEPIPGPGRKLYRRHFPRPRASSRRVERRQRPSERGDALRRPRDLRPLSRRDRPLQAAHPCRSRRNRAQHEHRRQARRDGGGIRSECDVFTPSVELIEHYGNAIVHGREERSDDPESSSALPRERRPCPRPNASIRRKY